MYFQVSFCFSLISVFVSLKIFILTEVPFSKVFFPKGCILFFQDFKLEFNKNVVNVSVSMKDYPTTGTIANITFENFYEIERLMLTLKINIQENEQDDKYQKQIARTSIDVSKLLKDINSNFIFKTISGDLLSSLDFDPNFPWERVRIIFIIKCLLCYYFTGDT